MAGVRKPFGIRVEETASARFKALAIVLNVDAAVLFKDMITTKEDDLNQEQWETYKSLLKVWKIID